MTNLKLSENFNLNEFVASQTATRRGYNEQFAPPDVVIDNIEALVKEVLQPLRNVLKNGTIHISSGYRCKRVNDNAGGAVNSQHLTGSAADCIYYENGIKDNLKLYETLIKSGLVFDQAIKEFGSDLNPAWIHISFNNSGKNRMQTLRIK